MAPRAAARLSGRRLLRLAGVAATIALAVCALMVLSELLWWLPFDPADYPGELIALACLGAYGWARRQAATRPFEDPVGSWSRRGIEVADGAAVWALRGRRPAAVAAILLAALLASWAPHYLTWPWWTDLDHFATLALSWDAGRSPWRDMLTYQFPGEIYLFWVVGKLFGWGRTVPLYVVDLGLLLGLGALTMFWSRRRLGRVAPGMVGYLAFVGFYVELPFTLVAQRDWHAAGLAVMGMLTAQAVPGRAGRLASAALAGLAVSFRPHAVFLAPAVAAAVVEQCRRAGESWPRAAGRLAEWSLACVLAGGLAFAPLVGGGLWGDFVGALRELAGSGYGELTPQTIRHELVHQLRSTWTALVLAANLVLATAGPSAEWRRLGWTWVLALVGVLAYKPIHPTQHFYLVLPLYLVESIALAPPLAWAMGAVRLSGPVRLAVFAVVLVEAMPGWPANCSPVESLRALGPLWRGEEPVQPPLGCSFPYPRPDIQRYHYTWADYRGVLEYLRRETGPGTPVANLLTHYPYPTLNGAVGRTTPLPVEAVTLMLWFPETDFDTTLAAHLERAAGAVVVWDDDHQDRDLAPRLAKTSTVIREHYRPAARFGEIEVWRRATPPDPEPGTPPRIRLRPEPRPRAAAPDTPVEAMR